MTPEGKIKNKVKRLLDKYEGRIYSNWPVPRGYGSPTLDCWGAIRGVPFAIETKAPKKDLTDRQSVTREEMHAGGIWVFRVRDDEELVKLAQWLEANDRP